MVGVYIDNRSAVATASHFNKGPSFLSTRGPNRSAKMAFATKDSHNHAFQGPIPVLASPPAAIALPVPQVQMPGMLISVSRISIRRSFLRTVKASAAFCCVSTSQPSSSSISASSSRTAGSSSTTSATLFIREPRQISFPALVRTPPPLSCSLLSMFTRGRFWSPSQTRSVISQTSPWACQSNRVFPFSCPIIRAAAN